jgi:hypothetical protein
MLTEEEKNKIIEEEKFRNEVRNSLNSSKKDSSKLQFLNSPFGLWILSTVFIGLITFGYNKYTDYLKANDLKRKTINDLAFEIGYRFEPLDVMKNKEDIIRYIKKLDNYPDKSDSTIGGFPYSRAEFKNRTTESLVWDFKTLTNQQPLINVYRQIKIDAENNILSRKTTGQLSLIGYYLHDYGISFDENLKMPFAIQVTNGEVAEPLGDTILQRKLQ